MRWTSFLLLMSLLLAQNAAPQTTASDTALKARIKTIEDREEIQRLLLNYGRFLDARRLADYANLFAKRRRMGRWLRSRQDP
jgi:SnoaL-like domain